MSMRSDFEVSALFGAPFLKGPGSFAKKTDGTYKSATVEAAYQGYELGRKRDAGQLARYDPSRSLQMGHMNEINDKLKQRGLSRPLDPAHVRVVLEVIGGSPT